MVEGVTEDVDDAAADGVFARLIDVFDLLEPVVDEQLIDEILRNPVPPLDGVGVALELLPRGDLFGHRLGETDHAHLAAQGLELVHHLGAHGDVGVVGALLLVGNPRTAGVEQNLMTALPEEGLEVVHKIGRALLVLEEKEVISPVALHSLRRKESASRTHESPRLDLGSGLAQCLHDTARAGIVVIEGKEVLNRHGARR